MRKPFNYAENPDDALDRARIYDDKGWMSYCDSVGEISFLGRAENDSDTRFFSNVPHRNSVPLTYFSELLFLFGEIAEEYEENGTLRCVDDGIEVLSLILNDVSAFLSNGSMFVRVTESQGGLAINDWGRSYPFASRALGDLSIAMHERLSCFFNDTGEVGLPDPSSSEEVCDGSK